MNMNIIQPWSDGHIFKAIAGASSKTSDPFDLSRVKMLSLHTVMANRNADRWTCQTPKSPL